MKAFLPQEEDFSQTKVNKPCFSLGEALAQGEARVREDTKKL